MMSRRPNLDNLCADCFEETCFGCGVWIAAHGGTPEYEDEDTTEKGKYDGN